MLSNFILCRSRVVKSLKFEPNVWRNWKLLDFAKFHPSHVASGQKCKFWVFLTWIKIAKCHPSQVRSGQTLDFKQNFQHDWKYLDFAKFHPSQVWSGQKSIFWARFSTQIKIFLGFVKFHPQSGQHCHFLAKFSAWLKISGFAKFHPLHVQSSQNSQFWAWFWLRLKISEFYHISSFACPEWSKMSVVS